MTSPYEGFKAETKALVENGNNRLEDALACEAARLFLAEVGSVPRAAFGEIEEYSQIWHNDWNTQFTARCAELASIRDALWNAGCGLLKVAGEYEDTDVEAAFIIGDTWSIGTTTLGGYLDPLLSHFSGITFRPGEPFPTDYGSASSANPLTGGDTLTFPHVTGDVLPTYTQETTIERQALDDAWVWEGDRHWPWEGDFWEYQGRPTIDMPKVTITATPGAENDALVDFVGRQDQGWALVLSETIIDLEGGDANRPMRDMIVPVWTASPTLFANRHTLLNQLWGPLPEILDRVKNNTGRLRTYWEGAGASAYLGTDGSGLAPMIAEYLAGLIARIEWFVQRCKVVETTLAEIRDGYATSALADVKAANAANDEYLQAIRATLSSPPTDRIATALDSTYSMYQTARDLAAEKVARELEQEKIAISGNRGIDLDLMYVEARLFQHPGGADGWAGSGLWKAKPGPLPGYEPE